MGNISGAMVFQSCLPTVLGILFTEWTFKASSALAFASAGAAFVSTLLIFGLMLRRGRLQRLVAADRRTDLRSSTWPRRCCCRSGRPPRIDQVEAAAPKRAAGRRILPAPTGRARRGPARLLRRLRC